MDSAELACFTSYWRIENFYPRRSNPNLTLESPVFKESIFDSDWILYLEQHNPSYIGVYISKIKNPKIISIHYSIALLTSAGWLPVLKKAKNDFVIEDKGWGIHKLVSWNKIANEDWTYLPHGSLTVKFHLWNDEIKTKSAQCLMISRMTVNMKLKHLPIQRFDNLKPNDLLSFPVSYELKTSEEIKDANATQTGEDRDFENLEDLITLFREKKFSFATLRSTKRDFVVHKAILCAKSPVFHAMFEEQIKENNSDIVEINDIDSDTLSLLVKFLYLELPNLNWDAAFKLYCAADKYQIETLKKICISQLKKELSDENICDAFRLADMLKDEDFKKSALKYFCNNSKSILLTESWKDLLLNKTELASEILYEMAKNL